MNTRRTVRLLALFLTSCAAVGAAQDPSSVPWESCDIPADLLSPYGPNIFSPEQEMHYGDAVAEHLEANFRVVEDAEANRRLQELGQRIVDQLPDTGIDFRFTLVDLPSANAFAVAGGNIYVSRKLVGMAESEDELAGTLAHEVAHVASRHGAIAMTDALRHHLGVTELSGRSGIRTRYHEYVEAAKRSPRRLDRGELHDKQVQADLVGLYAAAKAGYDPTAFASLLDRLTGAEGKKGNWFSDLLGTTRPGSKRLREMDREMRAFRARCGATGISPSKAGFEEFRALALASSGLDREEELQGLVSKLELQEPLPTTARLLRFSPDGRHVLALDDQAIYVYAREPFELSFYVNAPDATSAHFTPDSRAVLWLDRELHVERWSLDGRLEEAKELVVREGCLQPELSPDGGVLACFTYQGGLSLRDVSSGDELFRKKDFYSFTSTRTDGLRPLEQSTLRLGQGRARDRSVYLYRLLAQLARGTPGVLWTGFSPDGRYFAAAQPPRRTVAFDRVEGREVSLPGSIEDALHGGFTFLDASRIAAVHPREPEKSGVFAFPSGEVLAPIALGGQSVDAPGRGDYLLIRPVSDRPLGVLDLDSKELILTSAEPAFDIYEKVFVNQRNSGEIRLYRIAAIHPDGAVDVEVIASAALPLSGLGRLQAAAVSANLDLVALSERSRGGIWELRTGRRLSRSRGYRGAVFDGPTLYADFPKTRDAERRIIALSPNGPREGPALEAPHLRQIGDLLLGARASDEGVALEARRVSDLEEIWSREVRLDSRRDRMMRWFATPQRLALVWPGESRAAKRIVDDDPRMKERYHALDDTELVPVVEVVDARTGETLGGLLMEQIASSAEVEGVQAHGDTVVASLEDNRVLVYSLSTGELIGRLFGRAPIANLSAGLLGVENQADFVLYQLPSLEEVGRYRFAAPITAALMSAKSNRLFVLTNQQTAYVLELPEPN